MVDMPSERESRLESIENRRSQVEARLAAVHGGEEHLHTPDPDELATEGTPPPSPRNNEHTRTNSGAGGIGGRQGALRVPRGAVSALCGKMQHATPHLCARRRAGAGQSRTNLSTPLLRQVGGGQDSETGSLSSCSSSMIWNGRCSAGSAPHPRELCANLCCGTLLGNGSRKHWLDFRSLRTCAAGISELSGGWGRSRQRGDTARGQAGCGWFAGAGTARAFLSGQFRSEKCRMQRERSTAGDCYST